MKDSGDSALGCKEYVEIYNYIKHMECNHFSLLKTKGSASFSLASRSVSESRRLKVKLAVGSICGRKKKKDCFSPDIFEP